MDFISLLYYIISVGVIAFILAGVLDLLEYRGYKFPIPKIRITHRRSKAESEQDPTELT